MTKRYVPFAFGGIVIALLANAAIPKKITREARVAPVASVEPADEFDDDSLDEGEGEGDAPTAVELPARSESWRERHSIVPRAALERDDPKLDASDIHAIPALR